MINKLLLQDVRDVMLLRPVCAQETDLVKEAHAYFSESALTMLPVLNQDNVLVGVLTYVDFIRSRQILDMKIFLELLLVGLEEEIPNAAEKLNLEAYHHVYDHMILKDIMNTHYTSVEETTSLGELISKLLEYRHQELIVLNASGQVTGILSAYELLKYGLSQT